MAYSIIIWLPEKAAKMTKQPPSDTEVANNPVFRDSQLAIPRPGVAINCRPHHGKACFPKIGNSLMRAK